MKLVMQRQAAAILQDINISLIPTVRICSSGQLVDDPGLVTLNPDIVSLKATFHDRPRDDVTLSLPLSEANIVYPRLTVEKCHTLRNIVPIIFQIGQ